MPRQVRRFTEEKSLKDEALEMFADDEYKLDLINNLKKVQHLMLRAGRFYDSVADLTLIMLRCAVTLS